MACLLGLWVVAFYRGTQQKSKVITMKRFFKQLLGLVVGLGAIFYIAAVVGLFCWVAYMGWNIGYDAVSTVMGWIV